MPLFKLQQNSLIIYKNRPARILLIGKKIEIEGRDGETRRVREKDVTGLHPGPIQHFTELARPEGDFGTACDLLAGEETTLPELAELAFDGFTPASAWAVWQELDDGLYLSGEPAAIQVHTPERILEIRSGREAKAARVRARQAFLERLQDGRYEEGDAGELQEVVALAYGEREKSQVLRALNQSETPQQAHRLLLDIGYWDETVNPYPRRLRTMRAAPEVALAPLPARERRDLTHLPAFAIDDDDNTDPDDALSLDDRRLWIHIADVAALVPPGSPADREALARGANLYLPETTLPMLPKAATERLGLGLEALSPALSFGLDLDADCAISGVEIVPSWVKVTRITYAEAESGLVDHPQLSRLYEISQRYEKRRRGNGAVFIDMPEVKIRVQEGQVTIRPLPPLASRNLVREAMLMTGEAVALFAREQRIPIPFTVQDPPDTDERAPARPSAMLALRKMLKRSQQSTTPGLHAGLGLNQYAQATSPLRRYLDLVVHQQLHSFLEGTPLLDETAILERIGATAAVVRSLRQAERLSNTHWKLVYLQRNPDWTGEGVILDKRGNRNIALLPDLELETDLFLKGEPELDTIVKVKANGVNLPKLEAFFRSD